MFNVRAVTIDYYTSKLINEIYEKDDPSVNTHWLEPVIRIFGSTPDGRVKCFWMLLAYTSVQTYRSEESFSSINYFYRC